MLRKIKKRFSVILFPNALRVLSALIMVFTIVISSGCNKDDSNNVVNPSEPLPVITGKVVDYWGNGAGNLKVETSSGTTRTSADGSFIIQNLATPYDISVYSDFYGHVETFKNLSTTKPNLSVSISNLTMANKSDIMVIMPQHNSNQRALAIFYNDSGYYKSQYDFWGYNYGILTHQWNGNSVVQGKMTLWIYTTDNQGNITSFDKYGEKPLTLTSGLNSRVVFNDIDLNTNPADSILTGTVNAGANLNIQFASLGMNRYPFGNAFTYGSINWPVTTSGTGFSVLAPILNGNVYRYFINITLTGNNSGAGTKVAEIIPNKNNVISFNIFPTLISPEDNDMNVNFDTPFTFSKDYPNGIYKISLSYTKSNGLTVNRTIYTNLETYKLSNLSDTGLAMNDNMMCHWYVAKITGYNNTDDFVNIPPAKNPKYKEVLYSESRFFKTKFTKTK